MWREICNGPPEMVNSTHNDTASATTAIDAAIDPRRCIGRQPGSSPQIGFLNLGIVEQIAGHPLQYEIPVFENVAAV